MFGESSSGAAVVQGSYLAADQGGVRIAGGPAFRRVAGSGAGEARERSLKEAKVLMQQYAHRLNLAPSVVEGGFRLYRMAAMNNFVQGRRITNVVAMCLFAACRKDKVTKVMLIDLADLCKENVFKLGRNYKAFLAKFPEVKEGPNPEFMEDLIFRFASKLEFYEHHNKVALSAVRIAKRMQKDNMTHGRRPAGICGAAVIMAARAHSFRRTVREVVYIAKVTTHTIQQRMNEFANVPSAQMTIDEFHDEEFLAEQMDPPWWYKNSAAWKEAHPGRKRKVQELENDDDANSSTAGRNGEKRQRLSDTRGTSTQDGPSNSSATPAGTSAEPIPIDPAILPSPSPTPGCAQPEASVPPTTDKDGFVIPPLPGKATERVVTGDERAAIVAARGGDGELETLAQEFGDPDAIPERSTEAAMAAAQGIAIPALTGKKGVPQAKMGKKAADKVKNVAFDDRWLADEAALEEEMETYLHKEDLMSMAVEEVRKEGDERAAALLKEFVEEQRVDGRVRSALQSGQPVSAVSAVSADAPLTTNGDSTSAGQTPARRPLHVSEDPIVTEYEFADDPEVLHCLLGPAEAADKAKLWANENEDWMRAKQNREHNKKRAAKGPPKKTRNRTRVPRIGEGQASPASSAGEAALAQLQMRKVSMKLNQEAITQLFEKNNPDYHRTRSIYGGSSTRGTGSAATSRAGSVAPSEARSESASQIGESNADKNIPTNLQASLRDTTIAKNKENDPPGQASQAPAAVQEVEVEGDVEEEDEADYDQTAFDDDQTEYPEEIDPFADNNGDEDEWE
jgi:transcription factor IIIB subunit 2